MGNCSPRGIITTTAAGDEDETSNPIRVRILSGEIMEFKSPKLARDVVSEYPGFCIHRQVQSKGSSSSSSSSSSSTAVPQCEYLVAGQFYYLVPIAEKVGALPEEQGHLPVKAGSAAAMHVLPSHRDGVWKVKLVIDTKRLEEIWSEQENVEALIDKMRMAAAASESLTPRRSRSSWGLSRKPAAALSHLLTLPN